MAKRTVTKRKPRGKREQKPSHTTNTKSSNIHQKKNVTIGRESKVLNGSGNSTDTTRQIPALALANVNEGASSSRQIHYKFIKPFGGAVAPNNRVTRDWYFGSAMPFRLSFLENASSLPLPPPQTATTVDRGPCTECEGKWMGDNLTSVTARIVSPCTESTGDGVAGEQNADCTGHKRFYPDNDRILRASHTYLPIDDEGDDNGDDDNDHDDDNIDDGIKHMTSWEQDGILHRTPTRNRQKLLMQKRYSPASLLTPKSLGEDSEGNGVWLSNNSPSCWNIVGLSPTSLISTQSLGMSLIASEEFVLDDKKFEFDLAAYSP